MGHKWKHCLKLFRICKNTPSNIIFISSAGALYPSNNEVIDLMKDLISPILDYGKQKHGEKLILNLLWKLLQL